MSFLPKGGADSTDTCAEIELDIACGTGAKGPSVGRGKDIWQSSTYEWWISSTRGYREKENNSQGPWKDVGH